MTYKEFLAHLGKTPRKWTLTGGRMRLVPDFSPLAQCPISAVCTLLTGKELIAGDWEQAAALIGLNEEVAKQVMESGDDGVPSYGFYSEEVRQDLLRATGLVK
jgi:hypothetical protein